MISVTMSEFAVVFRRSGRLPRRAELRWYPGRDSFALSRPLPRPGRNSSSTVGNSQTKTGATPAVPSAPIFTVFQVVFALLPVRQRLPIAITVTQHSQNIASCNIKAPTGVYCNVVTTLKRVDQYLTIKHTNCTPILMTSFVGSPIL